MSNRSRSTDHGTVVLHALLIGAFVILLSTGLRIAADDPEAPSSLSSLDAVLPVEHLWWWHMVAGVVMVSVIAAYVAYVRSARLQARVRFDRTRVVQMLSRGRQRWSALNIVVYWVLMTGLVVEVVTGAALYLGHGAPFLAVHLAATFVCAGCVVLHVALHAAAGGARQLVRVARPGPLHIPPPQQDLAELLAEQLAEQARHKRRALSPRDMAPEPALPPMPQVAKADRASTRRLKSPPPSPRVVTLRAHPVANAVALLVSVAGLSLGVEQATRQTLNMREIAASDAPKLDGDLADPVWARTTPVKIRTTQGGDFGGTHESVVEVRAVHDGTYAYFAFVWEDPTRSLKQLPLVKKKEGWRVVASREDLNDENTFNEDKFAVLLARGGLPLIGGAIHLGTRPLAGKPGSVTERGLHYTTDGGIADLWQWRASHGGPGGHIDNGHFGGPEPPPDQALGKAYAGGFALDPGHVPYVSNYVAVAGSGGETTVRPLRLPRDPLASARHIGRLDGNTSVSENEASRWWMTEAESVPYSAAFDARLPEGTIIPGIIASGDGDMKPNEIRGSARWSAGRWTLELARRLYTGSKFDTPIKSGALMWLAAFDHAEKRHTRHLRPLVLEVD